MSSQPITHFQFDLSELDLSSKLPLGQTESLLENLEDRLKCCEHKPAEFRLSCLEDKIKGILKTQEECSIKLKEQTRLSQEKMLRIHMEALECQKKESNLVIEGKELRLNMLEKKIESLTKNLQQKQAVIDDQNKIIKQQKQRITKADKQLTKNHNLKMHTETLKSKVSKLQEEIDALKECQLCFEPYDHDSRIPSVAKCTHVFCKDCLTKHTHSNSGCPMCRKSYTIRDVRELHLHFI